MEVLEKTISGLIFKGAKNNPFLAPRGIWITDKRLFISDTGQNRVFIWNKIPETEFEEPDVVLGQPEKDHTSRNAGDQVSASTLQYPSGIWSNDKVLIVADAWNHRVLIWKTIPKSHGQPADIVLGQPDFFNNQPNGHSIGAQPYAQSLNWPYGIHSDGNRLWIADTGNRRVLYFEKIPYKSFTPADQVIGQAGFGEKEYDSKNAIWPYSVRVSPQGEIAITDTQYFRVLLWENHENAFHQQADYIIGQPDFDSSGQNQFGLRPSSKTLNWCYDSFFHKEGIWVADTGNSRLLWFDQLPQANNAEAKDLIGHDNFETGSENPKTVLGTESSLYWPFSISINGRTMAIADTGNHRVILKGL